MRHATDEAGAVVYEQSYDPLYASSDAYGYTGEWWVEETGLLHLRARWYDPASGTFLSRDAVESEPPYQYVRGNVVNLVDPSGLTGVRYRKPTHSDWIADSGPRSEVGKHTYYFALEVLYKHHQSIINAAQRHGLAPSDLCTAQPHELFQLYAFAGILFQESVGYYREFKILDNNDQPIPFDPDRPGTLVELLKDSALAQEYGAYLDLDGDYGVLVDLLTTSALPQEYAAYLNKDYGNSTLGIGQLRPDTTGLEVEQLGILYDPYLSTPNNPVVAAPTVDSKEKRIDRLLDPVWAIEYAAANLHQAQFQPGYHAPGLKDPLGRNILDWQKRAGWYNKGVFNVQDPVEGSNIAQYMHIIWSNMEGIMKFDLLRIKQRCDCGRLTPLPTNTPSWTAIPTLAPTPTYLPTIMQ